MTRVKSPGQLDLFDCHPTAPSSTIVEDIDSRVAQFVTAVKAMLDNWDDLFRIKVTEDTDPHYAFRILEFSWKHLKPLFPIIAPDHPYTNGTIRLAAMKVQYLAFYVLRWVAEMPPETWV